MLDLLIKVVPRIASFWSLVGLIIVAFTTCLAFALRRKLTQKQMTILVVSIPAIVGLTLAMAFTAQAMELKTKVPPDRVAAKIDELRAEVLAQISVATNMIDIEATTRRWGRFTLADTHESLLLWASRQLGQSGEGSAISEFLLDNLDTRPRRNGLRLSASGMLLVEIPSGTFAMGNTAETGRDSDEGPETTVTFDYMFWIGKFEVTQLEFERVRDPGSSSRRNPSFFNRDGAGRGDRQPLDNVTWEQARDFCDSLTRQEKPRIPNGYEFRLPTEAEWEYACRAGTTTRFSFGDSVSDLPRYAWYDANSRKTPHEIGSKLPNAWGIYDMHGNVMEWCYDWYRDQLPGGAVRNRIELQNSGKRCLRGGSWASSKADYLRSSDRFGLPPSSNGWAYGFRVVLGPSIQWLKEHQK